MSAAPRICEWGLHLIEEARKLGVAVTVRRDRNGSPKWQVGAARWEACGPAHRRLERMIYGREHP